MTSDDVVATVGGFLQLAGVIVAGVGIHRTKAEYAAKPRGAWDQTKQLCGALRRKFSPHIAARAEKSPETTVTVYDPTVETAPMPGAPDAQFKAEIVEQLNQLQRAVGRLRHFVAAEGRQRHDEVTGLGAKMDSKLREAMVGGLALEVGGLCLGALGAGLTVFAAFF